MLRLAANTLVRRATPSLASVGRSAGKASSTRYLASQHVAGFHSTARREEEAKEKPAGDDGFLGTGLSHWYAIPVGVAFAVPAVEFEWFIFNEETLLASTFLAFCVVAYNQGGDLISNALKEEAAAILKQQNEAEDKVIAKLEETLAYMDLTENIVQDYQGVLDLTEQSYAKLNAAGQVKPQHMLKAQVEKILTMIAAEENNAYDKAKTALMEEATASVTAEFAGSKELQKASLDAAIAKLTGKKGTGADPVQAAYVNFFQAKAAQAKAADATAEAAEARKAMVTKLNATCENEGMYFRLDESGQPKLVV